ncbi:AAA family ATPase [Pseudoalteromonas sp. Of7M-16]|uniref:AAA family ATPase n=1 Tax=Pseudoalteromonas sp. Of7M-16 TaxID=2917756 RepID=UPI001EF62F9B|nr:AAA family ATPase [Pseudoalteromonas sp. Of7M-16]MCG7549704.1 SPOR domain-containing protein [Pseudoalteromonas sp. Of7M-16]
MQSQILPSRSALVDRIAMQFEYGQSLICLVGNSGLGKSYLAESFITDKYSDFSKAFIQLSAHTKDVDIVRQLMEHTFRAPLVDQKLSLTENFFVLNSEQPAEPCLWVLDGARHLSDELIQELQNLAVRAPNTLYILVTAQAPNMLPNALDIHLEPLSHAESKQLMKMFFTQLPPDDDPIFKTFLTEARGNPSVLLDWQQEEQQLDLRAGLQPRLKQKHFFIAAFSLILTLCLVAALYNKQLLDLLGTKQEIAKQQTAILSEPTVLEAEHVLEAKQVQPEVEAVSKSAQSELEVQNKPEQEQVSAVLNALLSAPSSSVTNSEVAVDTMQRSETSATELGPELGEQDVAQVVTALQPNKRAETQTEASAQVVSENTDHRVDISYDNQWFLLRSDTEWSIQLLAVTERKVADDFIAKHALPNIKVAEVNRNGKVWWFVTLAPFAQLDDAKLARGNLNAELLAAKPFFKRISQIKQQIQQSQ